MCLLSSKVGSIFLLDVYWFEIWGVFFQVLVDFEIRLRFFTGCLLVLILGCDGFKCVCEFQIGLRMFAGVLLDLSLGCVVFMFC